MPRGDKSSYTDKQKRKAEHIEEGYKKRGVAQATKPSGAPGRPSTRKPAAATRADPAAACPTTSRRRARADGSADAPPASRPAAARSRSARKAAATRKKAASTRKRRAG